MKMRNTSYNTKRNYNDKVLLHFRHWLMFQVRQENKSSLTSEKFSKWKESATLISGGSFWLTNYPVRQEQDTG